MGPLASPKNKKRELRFRAPLPRRSLQAYPLPDGIPREDGLLPWEMPAGFGEGDESAVHDPPEDPVAQSRKSILLMDRGSISHGPSG